MSGLVQRMRAALVMVVGLALGIRLADHLLAPYFPLLVVLAVVVGVGSFALLKR